MAGGRRIRGTSCLIPHSLPGCQSEQKATGRRPKWCKEELASGQRTCGKFSPNATLCLRASVEVTGNWLEADAVEKAAGRRPKEAQDLRSNATLSSWASVGATRAPIEVVIGALFLACVCECSSATSSGPNPKQAHCTYGWHLFAWLMPARSWHVKLLSVSSVNC